jgi:branched-chain amino acid transport system ATP-binding protein
MSALLEARAINVRYGKVEAIPSADLSVEPNQIATLIGPNGAGKSTLLNALMGALLKPGRSSGTVLFDGEDIAPLPVPERCRRGLVLVPETRELFGTLPVEDNLVLGAYLHRKRRDGRSAQDLERVYALFPRLKERRSQEARTLSGGERQMLALGRALMGRPRLLMLDEPSLGLAPRIVGEMFAVIQQLPSEGMAVLLVEQNARAALRVAQQAYVLENGRITLQGPAAELRDNPRVIDTYLGLAGSVSKEDA